MSEDILRAIGKKVYQERRKMKMSQEKLAAETGVDRRTISTIERGGYCKNNNFLTVILFLGIPLDGFLYDNEVISLSRMLYELDEPDRKAVSVAIKILLKSCFRAMS